jgi:hypothetical protein
VNKASSVIKAVTCSAKGEQGNSSSGWQVTVTMTMTVHLKATQIHTTMDFSKAYPAFRKGQVSIVNQVVNPLVAGIRQVLVDLSACYIARTVAMKEDKEGPSILCYSHPSFEE